MGLDRIILGKKAQSVTDKKAHFEYDTRNRVVVMLIKLSMIDDTLPE